MKRIPAIAPIKAANRRESTRMHIPKNGLWKIIVFMVLLTIPLASTISQSMPKRTKIGNASVTILNIQAECNYEVYGEP
jgi:hypothetical protein